MSGLCVQLIKRVYPNIWTVYSLIFCLDDLRCSSQDILFFRAFHVVPCVRKYGPTALLELRRRASAKIEVLSVNSANYTACSQSSAGTNRACLCYTTQCIMQANEASLSNYTKTIAFSSNRHHSNTSSPKSLIKNAFNAVNHRALYHVLEA
jgi:hypothetical protein